MRCVAMFSGVAALAAVAGCSNEPEVDARNASVAEVAEEVREAGGADSFVRPGKWQSEVQFLEFSMPGAPPEAQAMMRRMNERNRTFDSCLTPEQAKRPKEDFFAGAGKNCRYERFTMGDGKIDAVMRCSEQGATQTMAMQGTYGPDDYAMQMTMQAAGLPGAGEGMTMKMRIDAKRVGECDDKSA